MKNLKITYERRYFSRNSNKVYVFKVTGDADSIKAYIESKVKDGAKLESIDCKATDTEPAAVRFYTITHPGKQAELAVTSKGTWVAEESDMQLALLEAAKQLLKGQQNNAE